MGVDDRSDDGECLFPDRRQLLQRCGMGLGGLALTGLLSDLGMLTGSAATYGEEPDNKPMLNPLAPKSPHYAARARRVIHVFANGGPSQIDTFDPKPALAKHAGEPLPGGNLKTMSKTGGLLPSPFRFRKHGRSGIEVSELFPHVAESIDEICVVRSMQTDVPQHETSILLMLCGNAVLARPSMGAWVAYGLGSMNENLPGFIVLCPGGAPKPLGARNWQSAFLPGTYQGIHIDTQHADSSRLIENIRNESLSADEQIRQLNLVSALNREHQKRRPHDTDLEARIQAFELASRPQAEAVDAFDIADESKSIHELYGPGTQARQLLMARRLLERGVRFVQVWSGVESRWDAHDNVEKNHRQLAQEVDRPLGALLTDLKQRGMLEDTLVVWGGEFGRTPTVELKGTVAKEGAGRDHNHYGFTMWLAGGGVRGGHVHGATDDFGFKAVEDPMHVHDLQATILHLLGFDHERLTYRYAGRDFRLTDVHGHVVKEIIA